MKDFQYPDDIYTEAETDPNTLANLGPLARLAGVWEGKRGVDIIWVLKIFHTHLLISLC